MPLRRPEREFYTEIMIRVLILEEHEMVRRALESHLRATTGVDVIRSTGSCADAIACAADQRPDVVLMEIKTPTGMDTLRALRQTLPGSAIIVLTSYLDSREEARVLQMGAYAYLLKSLDTEELVSHIQESAETILAS